MPVQKMRLQRGWSQQQLAELSGLSTRTIQRIERGEPPSVESLKALASVFEVDFSELRETNMNATPTNPSDIEEALAFKHVRKLRGFYIHLIQYVVVVGALTVFNLWRTPDRLWFGWVAAGWGIGLLFHALRVFNRGPFLGAKWETEQVEKYLGRKL
ncbi:2TM domain-containing protein [soil metagenome]